mmetsp:Transcript_27171/g.45885  ORF Transcript_27171/g.45885 Transcript_27171/m.45885 type:complete len:213 (-) Transcript_27171:483-1121(-)
MNIFVSKKLTRRTKATELMEILDVKPFLYPHLPPPAPLRIDARAPAVLNLRPKLLPSRRPPLSRSRRLNPPLMRRPHLQLPRNLAKLLLKLHLKRLLRRNLPRRLPPRPNHLLAPPRRPLKNRNPGRRHLPQSLRPLLFLPLTYLPKKMLTHALRMMPTGVERSIPALPCQIRLMQLAICMLVSWLRITAMALPVLDSSPFGLRPSLAYCDL